MVWLHWVFVATQAFSSCGMWALSSPSRLSTLVPYIGRQILFIYLFMVELRLRCCVQAFPSCHEHGTTPPYLQDAVFLLQWLLWLQSTGSRVLVLQGLWHVGSGVVALRLTCLAAGGIIPDQGWNPCPLHWQILNHWTSKEGFNQEVLQLIKKNRSYDYKEVDLS